MRWVSGIALAVFAVATASCIDLADCTAEALVCEQTTVTLQSPNDSWTAGAYTLAMVIDGVPQQCTMQIADPTIAVQGTCAASGTTLSLAPVCPPAPTVCNAEACSQSVSSADCIAGRFTMVLTIGTGSGFVGDAQPHVVGQLALDLSVDGNELTKEMIAPKVTTTGTAECGFCTNASATISIASG
jgi:hypothetical protein